MLAFILLVVLGGGVGLLVVSLAESPKPATDARGGERDPDADQEDPEPVTESPSVPATAPAPPVLLAPERPRRVRDPRNVPRSLTAVEGLFDDVAVAPWWRRLLSLVAVLVITVVIGAGLAAVTAAAFGAAAEFIDTAVG